MDALGAWLRTQEQRLPGHRAALTRGYSEGGLGPQGGASGGGL
ncbi:MAG: hypothetical protein WA823_06575 [Candidatus Acidiferrales bacterium]